MDDFLAGGFTTVNALRTRRGVVGREERGRSTIQDSPYLRRVISCVGFPHDPPGVLFSPSIWEAGCSSGRQTG